MVCTHDIRTSYDYVMFQYTYRCSQIVKIYIAILDGMVLELGIVLYNLVYLYTGRYIALLEGPVLGLNVL